MTLSCENSWKKRTYGPGIYINEVTVVDVEDISGQTLPFAAKPFDIGIRIHVDVGRDFFPALVIAGDFKRDPDSGEVIGWGGGFVLQQALSKLGYSGTLTDDNRLPQEVLEALVGRRFLRLSFVSGTNEKGKLRYSDWNHIATLEEGPDDLLGRFKRSLQKGYPRNYRPELLNTEHVVDPIPAVNGEVDPF